METTTVFLPQILSLIIEPTQAGQRIDKCLSLAQPSYSRSFFQQLIDGGHVSLNNSRAKSSALVKTGDQIMVNLPAAQPKPLFSPVQSDLGIEIIATHEHFLIINKPAPLLVHQTEGGTTEPTVVDWLLTHHYELHEVGTAERPGIVHRLDKETSGLLIIPRTNYAHMIFGDLFKKRGVQKTYVALVEGHPPAQGGIDLAIGRHPTLRKKMIAKAQKITLQEKSVRDAFTHYKVLQYFEHHALVEVKPVTGRTHQIRVHMSAIGHPLVGDYLYGTPSKLINRHALHAQQISFSFKGELFQFRSEIPLDFQNLIAFLKNT